MSARPGIRWDGMPVVRRIRLGVLGGVILAGMLAALATFLRINEGSTGFEQGLGISYTRCIAVYFGTLPVSGGIAAIFAPLSRSPWGAGLLGVIVALPTCFAVAFTANMGSHFEPLAVRVGVAIGLTLFLGGGAGVGIWFRHQRKKPA